MKYAVTAATGRLGSTVIDNLVKLVGAENIVAIARNAEKAKQMLPADVEVCIADYTNKSQLVSAFQGVDRVLFISSQPGQEVSRAQQHTTVVEALRKAQVPFVAYTSFPDAPHATSALADDHKLTEKLLDESGLAHSVVRNNWYLENDLGFLQAGLSGLTTYWANGRTGWALEAEYAEGAARVLVAENPKPVYEFDGQLRTYAQLGEQLNVALREHGKPAAQVEQVSQADYQAGLVKNAHVDEATAALFASFQEPANSGSLEVASNDLPEVLGHELTAMPQAIAQLLSL